MCIRHTHSILYLYLYKWKHANTLFGNAPGVAIFGSKTHAPDRASITKTINECKFMYQAYTNHCIYIYIQIHLKIFEYIVLWRAWRSNFGKQHTRAGRGQYAKKKKKNVSGVHTAFLIYIYIYV